MKSAIGVAAVANYFDGQYVSDSSPQGMASPGEFHGLRALSARGAVRIGAHGSSNVRDRTQCVRGQLGGKSLLDRGFRRLRDGMAEPVNALVVFQDRAITKGYGACKPSDGVPLIIAAGCARNFG